MKLLFRKVKKFRFTYTYTNSKKRLIFFNDIFARTEADAVAKFLYSHPTSPTFAVEYKVEVIE